MGDRMDVEVRVTPRVQDAALCSWHALRLRPFLVATSVVFFVALPWFVLLAEFWLGKATPSAILELGLLPVLAILAFGIGIPSLVYGLSERSPAAGDVVHRITDDGITTTGNGWDRTLRWSVVTGCDVWRGAILLRSGRQDVLYIPAQCTTPELVSRIRARVEREGGRAGDA
jgi:hypothetical protein